MNIRTDLAREALASIESTEGVRRFEENWRDVSLSRILIETERAAKRIGKPIGTYVTIEASAQDRSASTRVSRCIASELMRMLRILPQNAHILVIGLGNREVTPDSLGPRTVEKLFVTRHISRFMKSLAPAGMRPVSAFCPGVLGVTGLETTEVVRGVIAEAEPAAVLCVDELASARSCRITSAVQMNDSGLLPGAGVGNRQRGLDMKSLGVPVFAIGVPTVVYASTIALETIRLIEEKTGVSDQNGALTHLAEELMGEETREGVVTPKDIDALVEDASRRLAEGINHALYGALYEDVRALCLY